MQDRLVQALKDATAQRGKNKGMLKAKCPPMGTDGAIMWNAIMLYANPYKVGMTHLLCGAVCEPEFKQMCDDFARDMDRDRVALENLGVW